MSAPYLELLPLAAALVAALGGSLHCAVMCGPLRLLSAGVKGAPWKYQLGRALAYGALGAAAGGLGFVLPWWALVALIVLGFALSVLRVEMFSGLRARLLRAGAASPFFLGLASGLLPCGLLHGWVAAAAASAHPLQGAALMLTLWLGSTPALELAPGLLRRPIAALRARHPRALTAVLLAAALVPLAMRIPAGVQAGHGHGLTRAVGEGAGAGKDGGAQVGGGAASLPEGHCHGQ